MTDGAGPRKQGDLDAAVRLLRREGLISAEPVESSFLPGGSVAVTVLVTAGDGRQWVVKRVPGSDPSLLAAEAEGLAALAASGTVALPRVYYQDDESLVMQALGERPDDSPTFWQRLGEDVAALQAATQSERHGWPHDNWLGGLRQHNGWDADGHRFFAERRVLRFLDEPRVRQELSAADLAAVERFCLRLPDLVPAMPAVLLHGDLWAENVLAGSDGRPTLIDPGVCYGWAEVDISVFRFLPRPAASDRFFDAWQEAAQPEPGWVDRASLLHVRELLSGVAQFGNHYGAADLLRALLAPFRRRGPAKPV